MSALPKTPSFRLDGRRALITGAGRGIGLAAAAALADAGAHVVLAARSTDEIEAGAEAIRRQGGKAEALTLDVSDSKAAEAAIGEAAPFHILVNNAGTNRPKLMVDVTYDDYDMIMGLNTRAAFFVARATARRMAAAQIKGSIINVSSQMGHIGGATRAVYCASKHAVEGFSKAMAVEFGPLGIRVNTLCPTFIVTDLTRRYFDDPDFKAHVLGKIKIGRVGELEDIMGPIVFLASDASALMTGSALMIDGGWTAD
jgi:NAD(P)-dependent dehydrogenase (short-subunit alcohol dehydrogenase family)